jgi:hypothetical protein
MVFVDTVAPTSTVAAVAATTSAASFTVYWSGSDQAPSSGISAYDVYVSDDGGPFTLLRTGTNAMSAIFTGQAGNTYGFASVAIDGAGNTQPLPTSAQASITISQPPYPPLVVVGEQALFRRKLNSHPKAVGKVTLAGFSFSFNEAINSSTAMHAANYQIAYLTTKKVKRKTTEVLHPITSFSAAYDAASESVTLTLAGQEAFALGGQIALVSGRNGGITSALGTALGGATVFTIGRGGRTLTPQ